MLAERHAARVRRDTPESSKLHAVYALDTESSGLLLVAKDAETQSAPHRILARREADLRHVAWLDGNVAGDRGLIELPLRSDPDERVRHIVAPVHGKRAVSEWRVTRRTGTRTRVSLLPRTRHPHQLRVHSAHPRGLGAPIVGDTLDGGRDDTRMMLHLETLSFVHPHTGERIDLERKPPF